MLANCVIKQAFLSTQRLSWCSHCRQARTCILYTNHYVRWGKFQDQNKRCYSVQHPQDQISPPTKLWRYLINRFTSYVEHYENKLEKKSPRFFNVYKTIKCVRYILADTRDYISVSKDMWIGRELHTFSRRELEIYQEMPKNMMKIAPLILLASIPVIGNLFLVVGYWFPRTMFTHHFWNDAQKEEFRQHFHTARLTQYHHVLEALDRQTHRHSDGENRHTMVGILDKVAHSGHPTVDELVRVKPLFESFPLSLEVLPLVYFRHIAKSCDMPLVRSRLLDKGVLLLHTDRAMVKEGFHTMTDDDICKACLARGLNPYGMTKDDQLTFLKQWTDISANLDETSISLLLHCPTLVTYNSPSNIRLMKGKRYRWRRRKHMSKDGGRSTKSDV